MQTFLPYKDFAESAKCLDNKRLGKQRVECLQILNCLLVKETRWKNHPAIKMWRGYEYWLCRYGLTICNEWQKRGYKDTCYGKIETIEFNYLQCHKSDFPKWITDEFCQSHRSNLLRKNLEYYSKFGWNVPNDLPYIWPTKIGGK